MYRLSVREARALMITDGNVPRHPVLNCLCSEGRIIEDGQVRYMPAAHNCVYILERNNALEAAALKKARTHAA